MSLQFYTKLLSDDDVKWDQNQRARLFHKKRTPPHTIDRAERKILGQQTLTRKRVEVGSSHEVYKATRKNDTDVYIRISYKPHAETNEQLAVLLSGKASIPIPTLLGSFEFSIKKSHGVISIYKAVHGSVLEFGDDEYYLSIEEKQIKQISKHVGHVLSQIHSVKVDKFGPLYSREFKRFNSFDAYLTSRTNNSLHYMLLAAKTLFSPWKMCKLLYFFRKGVALRKQVKHASLVHNDFSPKHVFFRDTKIVGIIDWETAVGSHPYLDFINWEVWHGEDLPVSWLLSGYTTAQRVRTKDPLYLHLKLHYLLVNLSHYYSLRYAYAVQKMKRLLDQTLIELEKEYLI